MTKKFNAFTLAEVLITLGIIGVVAAMTMPTLINQTNGAQYKAAYKKALSAISQGVTLNVALEDISFADADEGTAGSVTPKTAGTTSIASLINSRMNVVKTAKKSDLSTAYQSNVGSVTTDITCTPGDDDSSCTADKDDATKGTKTITPDTFMFFNDSSMFAFASSSNKCKSSSENGLAAFTVISAFLTFAAATIFIALVIFLVF